MNMNHQEIGGLDDLFDDNERITNCPLCRPELMNHCSTPSNARRTSVEQYSLFNNETNVFKEATVGIAAVTRPPTKKYGRSKSSTTSPICTNGYEPENELEAYITSVAQHQPYTTQRPKGQPKKSKINENSQSLPKKVSPPRPRQKRESSIINKLVPYDVSDDIINSRANVTLGQILQYPDQCQKLAKVLKCPLLPLVPPVLYPDQMKTHAAQDPQFGKTIATRCYIKIRNNPILAVLDSGAAVSIMFNKIVKKLDLKITEFSTTMVIIANRARVRALGKVVDVKLVVDRILVPTTFQVIKSTDKTLLLGMDWFKRIENPLMELEDDEDKGTFDEFEFEDESLEEAEGYFTCKTSGIDPATYLLHVEELLSNEPEPEPEEEELLEVKLEKNVCSSSLLLE
ncbi:16912_t:CDS:2 [Cetraspora pellucida]|uniref:16912_t:CDS:1 n=1 Tax=Cetraspora pellucida TaxID=1433469 RepID=A0A9N9E635_9GLOM|nr:16912_t:CDS:2 [Cetraspora pellucida]